jgi:hypothetical protein
LSWLAALQRGSHRRAKLEHDEQVARWIELTAAKEVSDNLSETPNKGGRPGKTAAAASEIGINERDAQRAVKIASLRKKPSWPRAISASPRGMSLWVRPMSVTVPKFRSESLLLSPPTAVGCNFR